MLMRHAIQSNPPKLYSEDVFSTYTYTGNGTSQTITNGIDLAGEGGLVWITNRITGPDHNLYDVSRGATKGLKTYNTDAESTRTGGLTAFLSSGFSVGNYGGENGNNEKIVSWVFRKAPKFFDIVTYTGNGVAGRQIPHNLGCEVGMIVVKRLDGSKDWETWHRNLADATYLQIHSTTAAVTGQMFGNSSAQTSTYFSTGTVIDDAVNGSGNTYIAYLFAHDDSDDGIIQCGSFTTDGSGNATVELGWEPQYVMLKASLTTSAWNIYDDKRGLCATQSSNKFLNANDSSTESTGGIVNNVLATGFNIVTGASTTYIYMAIRRPNKPPTTGTQVYNAIARTGTGAAATVTGVGFAPDLHIPDVRSSMNGAYFFDKLRGANSALNSSATGGTEVLTQSTMSFDMDGITLGTNSSESGTSNLNTYQYINWFFKRAPGFFDQICYTGTGVARTVNHNLGVVPELMIVKNRTFASGADWYIYHSDIGNTSCLRLNLTSTALTATSIWNDTSPTAIVFSVGSATATNNSADSLVAYLFSSLPGISKIGSYTGNGTTLDIDCGFSAGCRFLLIKRTDDTGSWWVYDSTRGITAAADYALQLNSTAAEITTADAIDNYAAGVTVNQETTCNINVNNASYIFLSIA